MTTTNIPLSDSVDLLIIGGSSAAVDCAVAAAQAGRSVLLVEQRAYLATDRVSLLACADDDAAEAPSQLAIKAEAEQRLMDAGVRFRYGTAVIDLLLRDERHVGGALLATRSGWLAVAAAVVVDATEYALASRLLDTADWQLPTGKQRVQFRVVGKQANDEARKLAWTYDKVSPRNGEVTTYPVWKYEREVDLGGGSVVEQARAEQAVRLSCFHAEQVRTADALDVGKTSPSSRGLCAGLWRLQNSAALAECLSAIESIPATGDLRQAARAEAIAGCRIQPPPTHLRFSHCETIAIDTNRLPVLAEMDVLVIGGGTGGAPAGIAAARAGAQTMVCEYLANLGGVGTEGLIAKYYHGNRCGFTTEIDLGVLDLGDPAFREREGDDRFAEWITTPGKGWHTEHKMHWYLRTLDVEGGVACCNTLTSGVAMDGNAIVGAVVCTPWGAGLVRAKAVVDSTGCADIAAAAGAPCTGIGAEHCAIQGCGLSPRDPEHHYRNSDHTFVDDTDVDDVTQAHVVAKRRFPDAADCAQIIDSRERRQIIGEESIGPLDILAGRRWPDTVVQASSNFDTHGYTIHPVFMALAPHKKELRADVPYRVMLPQGIDGVLVTGLGMSAHRDALPVIRMQADVQNQGYAAGYAAATAAREGCALRNIDIKALQQHLVANGNLEERVLSDEDNFPLGDEVIAEAVASDFDTHFPIAVCCAWPERSVAALRAAYPASNGERRLRMATLLGLLGDATGAADLATAISESEWDKGWNFKGMGQFGFSLSELDGRIIALGRSGADGHEEVIRAKIGQMHAEIEFSHTRAIALALQAHPDPAAAALLAALLRRPGVSGHHQADVATVAAQINSNLCDTAPRNLSLREIHLARALYACGDNDGLGAETLTRYAGDLRGLYAAHARSLLADGAVRPDAA